MRQKALDYLESFGLDGTEISGQFTAEGFRLLRPGADADVIHPWPEGFDLKWFGALMLAARHEDLRLSKYRVVE